MIPYKTHRELAATPGFFQVAAQQEVAACIPVPTSAANGARGEGKALHYGQYTVKNPPSSTTQCFISLSSIEPK